MELKANIESNRQGRFTLRFDGLGPGEAVRYRLERLDFALGSYVCRSHFEQGRRGEPDGRQYLAKLETYFNAVTIPVFWHLVEPQQGRYDYEPYLAICRWARQNNKRMLGHAIFYGWDGLDDCDPADAHLNFIQAWVRALDRDGLETAMRAQVQSCLAHFEPFMSDFVLNNEVLGKYGTDPHDWFSRKLEFKSLVPYFRWARAASRLARFYVNENSILGGANTPKYAELIDALLQEGAPLGGIGIQGHFFGDRVAPADEMWQKLELLGRFGLPIRVTEFGVKATDPDLHARDMRRLLEVCFAHPRVAGVHFFNFWEPDMWPQREAVREAPLWNRDWSPRPAAEAFADLVTRQWMTIGSAVTDSRNEVAFDGFYGTYAVEAAGRRWMVELSANNTSSVLQ